FTTDVDTNSWTELTRVDYFYGGDYQDSIISVNYNNEIGLDSAKHYFFCTRVDAGGDITTYTGFNIRADTKTDYTMTNGAYTGVPSPTGGQPTTVVIEDGKFFSAGYGFEEATNSIILMGFNDVGVKEVENNRELAAYPNPAVNTITVPFGNVTGNATITVVDIAGKVVSTQTVNLTGGNVTLDVSDLESGMYSFNVVYANGTKGQFKVVVTK
ncbi:MAG TPA: T9SS type A sorting domain-containing protein, partial [Crocinitomix sp.]|nr:T9SS type A sorting domain-containing protein [Crocinitomix sp.]